MMTVEEITEYRINIPKEDLVIFQKAVDILANITDEMANHDCEWLEGGYDDCPTVIQQRDIHNAKCTILQFLNNNMRKMY